MITDWLKESGSWLAQNKWVIVTDWLQQVGCGNWLA